MTKLNMMDRIVSRESRHEKHRVRSRRSILTRLGLLALLMAFALGNRNCDDGRPPTITCTNAAVRVEPGTCTQFQNPCADGVWTPRANPDGFQLEKTDEQRALFAAAPVTVHTTSVDNQTTRSICVAAGSQLIASETIDFTYFRGEHHGTASIILTVARPLAVDATATPSVLSVGDSSQLVANVSGGIPPYFYSWIPPSTLNDNDVAAPVANPTFTTTYSVYVTDSGGQQLSREVTVFVREQLTVTAHPESILRGNPSQLDAIFEGGAPPYTFSWTPAEGLDDPLRRDPVATPVTTTTYNVTAKDSAGATLNGSVKVSVRGPLNAVAMANPSSINLGETSQLNAVVTGGVSPYTYSWSEPNSTNTLSDPLIRNPVASPEATTSYSVSVRDSEGTTVSDTVTVTVASSPPPTASFVFNVICCPTLNLDASASTGNIVSYTWDLEWTTTSPDRVTSSPTTSFTIQEFNRGTITLTVTDTAGRTATMTRNF